MTAGKVRRGDPLALRLGTWQTALCAALVAVAFIILPASADVAPGDKIDQSNWQKIEGLVAAPVLDYVKKGEYILNIGELNFEPAWEAKFLEASKANAGKYDIDADGGVIDQCRSWAS